MRTFLHVQYYSSNHLAVANGNGKLRGAWQLGREDASRNLFSLRVALWSKTQGKKKLEEVYLHHGGFDVAKSAQTKFSEDSEDKTARRLKPQRQFLPYTHIFEKNLF